MEQESIENFPEIELPDLNEIAIARTRLGWNQKTLAKHCNLSQSFITKIETGQANPSYRTVKVIFRMLNEGSRKAAKSERITAGDIMIGDADFVSSSDTIEEARRRMIRNDYSQLPVIDHGRVKGFITDKIFLSLDDSSKGLKIEKVIEKNFRVVQMDTKLETIRHLLAQYPALLVDKGERQYGIITKHDILKTQKY